MISVEKHDDGSDLATSQLEWLMRDEMRCRDIFRQRNQVVHVNVVRHSYTIKQVTSRGKSSPRRIIHALKTVAWPCLLRAEIGFRRSHRNLDRPSISHSF